MLQADLNSASLARRRVGERQNLLAASDGASRLLLPPWIAAPRFLVPFENLLLVLASEPRRLDSDRTGLADHHLPAA